MRVSLAVAIAVPLLAWPAASEALPPADPGRWTLAQENQIDGRFWQGHSSRIDAKGAISLLFAGTNDLYVADPATFARKVNAKPWIPATLTTGVGFNHIGDPSWDPADGGRLLLGLECYYPSEPVANRCGVGAIAVADPKTLAFRYAVKLDPADIRKAMWVESSPDGKLVWTSSGRDLLAYSASEITSGNSFTGPSLSLRPARMLQPVRRLAGAVPATGVTGAAFWAGRLLLAGQSGTSFQVWSVDTSTGTNRLEIERTISGESEGLDLVPNHGGLLQWSVMPIGSGGVPPTWTQAMMLSFRPTPAPSLTIQASASSLRRGLSRSVRFTVSADGGPVAFAKVSASGISAWTDRSGSATLNLRPRIAKPLRVAATLAGATGASVSLPVR